MILLDTDHFSILKYEDSARCQRLRARMQAASESAFHLAVISLEEQMRGWLAGVKRQRTIWGEIESYNGLAELFDFARAFTIVSLDKQAADHFDRLRKQKVRIGSMDLKIAAVALAHDALLLTANTRDFGRVPGLRFANWLDEESPGG